MDRENRKKIIMLGTFGLVLIMIGVSFAVFSANFTGTQTQSIKTGCLKIEMSDNGSLNMQNAYPMSDEEGLASTPYIYTIENICTVDAYYEATLNVMNGSNLSNLSKIKVALDGDSYIKPTMENKLERTTLLDDEITGVQKTYKLDEGYLRVGETKTFNLRTWIDYEVKSITGPVENKVIIQSEARQGNTLVYNTNSAAYFSGNKQTILKNVNYKTISSESGIVEQKENSNTRYFYRGNPNNEIAFGTYNVATGSHAIGDSILWKILSTNSDGSINIIAKESIGNSTYANVDTLLTSFYNTHLQDEESYIKTTATFCKEGATSGEYLGKLRVEGNNPSSKCNGTSTFTKIGLPTADEIMYAGGVKDIANSSYYLYGGSFLTGTEASSTTIYASNTSKSIYEANKTASLGVRPVITIKADTMLAGAGTTSEPYYVTGTYSNPSIDTSDTTKPVIKYARVEEQWSKTNKTISISASDNNKIAGYIVTDSSTAPSANDSGWEATGIDKYTTVNTYDNGTYYVFAKDEAGNVSDPEEVVVERVDKVAPTCTIRVNSNPDETDFKTLTIMSEDTNIDLKGYSWENRDDTTSVIKVDANGVYTAYLTDLAGNKGSCEITVANIIGYTVNVVVNNGTITGETTKFVKPTKDVTFDVTPNNDGDEAVVSCTNDQTGSVENNTLTVSNVTSNATCTVTYTPASTVLYTDGTLIINEKASDRSANITEHGEVTNEYAPLSNQNAYVFNTTSQPWNNQKTSVTRVEIGQHIEPTDTGCWFYGLTNMTTGNLTNLDTKNVTKMFSMFYRAGYNSTVASFTLTGLDTWDTSKVTDMSGMFSSAGRGATTWSIGDLSDWNVSKVTTMQDMFYQAGYRATTWTIGDLSNWDTSKVTMMNQMFLSAGRGATTWSIGDLDTWNTSQVTTMSSMFNAAGYSAGTFDIGDLSNWDTSNVINMHGMFSQAGYSATSWSIGDLSGWNTSSVTTMSHMLSQAGYNAITFDIGNLSNWDTSKVTNMTSMFNAAGYSATSWSIGDLSNWDTSKVTMMNQMFQSAGYNATTFNIGDLYDWDTSSVTNMSYMFSSAGKSATNWSIGDLSGWDTLKVTNMSYMFNAAGRSATSWSIGDLSGWDTSSVTNMGGMFFDAAYSATTFTIGNLSNWNTSKVTNMYTMFDGTGHHASTWSIGDLSGWDTSEVTTMYAMFSSAGYSATTFSIGDLSGWDTSKVIDMGLMFSSAGYSATTWNSIGTFKVYATNIFQMFYVCPKAKATLNIYSNPQSGSSGYNLAFTNAATDSSALITVNYSSSTTNIDAIVATKSSNSNVVKGVQLD